MDVSGLFLFEVQNLFYCLGVSLLCGFQSFLISPFVTHYVVKMLGNGVSNDLSDWMPKICMLRILGRVLIELLTYRADYPP